MLQLTELPVIAVQVVPRVLSGAQQKGPPEEQEMLWKTGPSGRDGRSGRGGARPAATLVARTATMATMLVSCILKVWGV